MNGYNEFLGRFKFNPKKAGFVGLERESFLTRKGQGIVPIAPEVLKILTDRIRFGYELSACQLEDRTRPGPISDLRAELMMNNLEILQAQKMLDFERSFYEVAPEDMPVDIYPDPDGRYQAIAKKLPREILLAACRVIGTHVHIGMPDHETALRVHNQVIQYLPLLSWLGDGSNGERLHLYRLMAPEALPRPYASWHDFHEEAKAREFDTDPRKCWNLIRISIHGTIEFRMFGATEELDRIVAWATYCHNLCEKFV